MIESSIPGDWLLGVCSCEKQQGYQLTWTCFLKYMISKATRNYYFFFLLFDDVFYPTRARQRGKEGEKSCIFTKL
jgi:hypothetical protein